MNCECVPCSVTSVPYTDFEAWTFVKYLNTGMYNVLIYGTSYVSEEKMCAVSGIIDNIISCLKNPGHRALFSGHKILLTGAEDVNNPNGQRNGGGKHETQLDTSLINHVATVDGSPFNRGWIIPVHEFGHSIEFKLGLQSRSDLVWSHVPSSETLPYPVQREYFTWAVQKWFSAFRDPLLTRATMPQFEREYIAEILDETNTWVPPPFVP